MAEKTRAEIEAERYFLFRRCFYGGSDWVGISSNAMLRAAMTDTPVSGFDIPCDQADLGRCEETYRRAPDHLKPKLVPILRGFRLVVGEHRSWPNPLNRETADNLLAEAIRRAAEEPAQEPTRGEGGES